MNMLRVDGGGSRAQLCRPARQWPCTRGAEAAPRLPAAAAAQPCERCSWPPPARLCTTRALHCRRRLRGAHLRKAAVKSSRKMVIARHVSTTAWPTCGAARQPAQHIREPGTSRSVVGGRDRRRLRAPHRARVRWSTAGARPAGGPCLGAPRRAPPRRTLSFTRSTSESRRRPRKTCRKEEGRWVALTANRQLVRMHDSRHDGERGVASRLQAAAAAAAHPQHQLVGGQRQREAQVAQHGQRELGGAQVDHGGEEPAGRRAQRGSAACARTGRPAMRCPCPPTHCSRVEKACQTTAAAQTTPRPGWSA